MVTSTLTPATGGQFLILILQAQHTTSWQAMPFHTLGSSASARYLKDGDANNAAAVGLQQSTTK
jgi:hypothetical protein